MREPIDVATPKGMTSSLITPQRMPLVEIGNVGKVRHASYQLRHGRIDSGIGIGLLRSADWKSNPLRSQLEPLPCRHRLRLLFYSGCRYGPEERRLNIRSLDLITLSTNAKRDQVPERSTRGPRDASRCPDRTIRGGPIRLRTALKLQWHLQSLQVGS